MGSQLPLWTANFEEEGGGLQPRAAAPALSSSELGELGQVVGAGRLDSFLSSLGLDQQPSAFVLPMGGVPAALATLLSMTRAAAAAEGPGAPAAQEAAAPLLAYALKHAAGLGPGK